MTREEVSTYIKAIMDPEAMDLPRLHCPKLNTTRYQGLLQADDGDSAAIRYFFALDLRQCVSLLPRLIGSIVEAIRFLGPEHCALSIVEGNSDDGTGEVLAALRPELEALNTTYYFLKSDIDTRQGNRIEKLARLRNLALEPLLNSSETEPGQHPHSAGGDSTTVLFLNDVAACVEDVLELAHQRRLLGADMTCAMDWTYVGPDPTFYDVWVARGMTGDSFFAVPPDGSWDMAWNLFWNDAAARERLRARRPFQVFSCWNGAVAFTAAPLFRRAERDQRGRAYPAVRFRAPRKGECYQGEPQLFCKDLWFYGWGKIAVVPVVNLEYSNEAGEKIKEAKGYTSRWVGAADWTDHKIEWRLRPPEGVKCMGRYDNQFFEAWNKTQPGT
ncbi:hypothetical protein VTK26DRAFT_3523 [Humicola hyalothermophila]